MASNYVTTPGAKWDGKLSERQKEIISYNREWFWGGTPDQCFLMKRLLERIHYLEDTVEELKNKLPKSA